MIVTLIGIEKFTSPRYHIPNGIECDRCGRQRNWPREELRLAIDALRADGWTGPMNDTKAVDGKPDLCPDCVRVDT